MENIVLLPQPQVMLSILFAIFYGFCCFVCYGALGYSGVFIVGAVASCRFLG
jgi:hypothetical protein